MPGALETIRTIISQTVINNSFCLRSNLKHSTVFYHKRKHLEVREKYSAARRFFNSPRSVSSGDEILCLMLDILLENLAVWQKL